MKAHYFRLTAGLFGLALISSCASTGVSPTGLAGGQIMCPSGPRAAIDCRGVLQQYARDMKADLNFMSKTQISLGLTTTKLTEADALTSDLLQHSYQTCTLYNACIIPPEEYAAKSDKLQDAQMQVRRALVGGGYAAGQQNIQINPGPGQPFPPPFPGVAPAPGFPQQQGMAPTPGFPQQPGMAPSPFPPQAGITDPNFPQGGMAQAQPFPGQQPAAPAANLSMNVPGSTGSQPGDSILNILRDASNTLRGAAAAPAAKSAAGPSLDTALRAMLQTLKQNVAKRSPALASGRAVVGNFTQANQPWSSPLGALLQDRVSSIVANDGVFKQSTGVLTRGISVQQVAAVGNASDPKALTSLYNADLAIAGTYQPQGDQVLVKLTAMQNSGEIAQTSQLIPASAIPDVVASTPQNAPETGQLLNSLNQIGPQAEGQLVLTTNRPGAGSTFRLGEEIMFFVKSNTDGYVYLFHSDADKHISRIFPNQFQQEARVQAGQVLQVPGPGAPFKFEASPPFGLETTFAIVTAAPLSDADLQAIQNGLGSPTQEVPAFLKTRGIGVVSAAPTAAAPPVQWNSTTVLVRP